MKTTKTWIVVATLGLLVATACAQSYEDEDDRRSKRMKNAAPTLFFTPEIIDTMINRITDKMSDVYAFDEDQVWNTRDVIKEEFPDWIQEHRGDIIQLANDYILFTAGDDPPTAEQVAEWSMRAMPLINEFRDKIDTTTEQMRDYMTDEQQVLLEGQKAMLDVGMNYMGKRMQLWADGGYDWETEWPRSPTFREQERERQGELHEEARKAEAVAMGLDPESDIALVSDETVGQDRPAGTKLRPAKQPKDEWTTYVEDFIKRYQLNEGQQNTAWKVYRNLVESRDRYLRKRLPDIKKTELLLNSAKTEEERDAARREYESLNQPIQRYFQQLKDRLNKLPSRKQRKEASARAEEAAPGKPGGAIKEQMDARAKAERESRNRE